MLRIFAVSVAEEAEFFTIPITLSMSSRTLADIKTECGLFALRNASKNEFRRFLSYIACLREFCLADSDANEATALKPRTGAGAL